MQVGELYVEKDDWDSALHCFKQAMDADERALYYVAYYTEQQAIHLGQGNAAAASHQSVIDAQQQVAALYWAAAEAGEPRALLWVANLHWDRGQVEQAMECWCVSPRLIHSAACRLHATNPLPAIAGWCFLAALSNASQVDCWLQVEGYATWRFVYLPRSYEQRN